MATMVRFYADRRDQDGDSRGAHAGASDSGGGGGGGGDSNRAVDGTSGQNQIRDDAEKGAATVVSKSLESAVKAPAEVTLLCNQRPHQTKHRRQRVRPQQQTLEIKQKLPPQRWMWTLEMKVNGRKVTKRRSFLLFGLCLFYRICSRETQRCFCSNVRQPCCIAGNIFFHVLPSAALELV